MDLVQVSYSIAVFGSLAVINLIHFLAVMWYETIFWTFSNTQILSIIAGYIGYTYTSALVYWHLSETGIHDAEYYIKATYTASYFFVPLAEYAYLQHSWASLRTLMGLKKAQYSFFDHILKVIMVVFFMPFISLGISFIFEMEIFYPIAVVLLDASGVIMFVFDCFALSIFSKHLFFADQKSRTIKSFLISKHGFLASLGVLLSITSNAISLALTQSNKVSASNLFLSISIFFLIIPIWSLFALVQALKKIRGPMSLSSQDISSLVN